MKKRTNTQKFRDYFDVFKCLKEDRKVKREGSKDGSIATHPIVPVHDLLEADVLKQCIAWLKLKQIFANRHDAGTFQNDRGQWGTYGIKNAGDIIGMVQKGRHFEIECKRGKGGRLSIGQRKRMADVRLSGGLYFVVHGLDELIYYFKEYV